MCDPINPLCQPTEVPQETSPLGSSLATLGWTVAVTALDQFLLQPLVKAGNFPEPLRVPSLFAGVIGTQAVLNKVGLSSASPAQALASLPMFTGLQVMARGVLQAAGIKPGWGSEVASLSLASLPFLLARSSPEIAGALTAVNAGEGFALKGLSVGAAALRIGASFANALGWMALVNFSGNWIADNVIGNLWCLGTGDYGLNKRLWNLERMSEQIYNADHMGSFLTAVLPLLPADDEGLRKIRDGLVAGSEEFGDAMEQNIVAIIAKNARADADGAWTVDWDGVESGVKAFYQNEENEENIHKGYQLIDKATAPFLEFGVGPLFRAVGADGTITDREAFKNHFQVYANQQLGKKTPKLEQRAQELGLASEIDGQMVLQIPETPNDEQNEFLKGEGLRLSTEIAFLSGFKDALL